MIIHGNNIKSPMLKTLLNNSSLASANIVHDKKNNDMRFPLLHREISTAFHVYVN